MAISIPMWWFGNMWNDNFSCLVVTMIERVHLALGAVGGGGHGWECVGKHVRLSEILGQFYTKMSFHVTYWILEFRYTQR